VSGYDLSTRFEEDLVHLEKYNPEMVLTVVYWEGEKEQFNVKRFHPELSQKPVEFITEHEGSRMEFATTHPSPVAKIKFDKRSVDLDDEEIELAEFISVKGVSAMGNRLTSSKVKSIDRIESEIPEEELEQAEEVSNIEEPSDDENTDKGEGSNGEQATLF
jgi:topoisomerase-4 subunit A